MMAPATRDDIVSMQGEQPPINPCHHCGTDLDRESTIIFQKVGDKWHRDCRDCWRAHHDHG